MKRKFLEELGLTKEQIDSIIDENGKDIENAKSEVTTVKSELEQVKTQLKEANVTIEGFKDYDQVKSQVEEYKTKYEKSTLEYESRIADMQLSSSIDTAINSLGGRNTKAIKALLDIESLKNSKNRDADIKSAIEVCQKENSYLFGSDEPIKNPISPTGSNTGSTSTVSQSMRLAMGLSATKENK